MTMSCPAILVSAYLWVFLELVEDHLTLLQEAHGGEELAEMPSGKVREYAEIFIAKCFYASSFENGTNLKARLKGGF